MALFDATPMSCLFAVQASPTSVSLMFARASHSLNSIGEISLFYTSALSTQVDLQPGGGSFLRMVQGQIEATNYTGIIMGYVALQDGDRTSVYSSLLEVVNVGHYGTRQTEIGLKVVR